MHHAYIYCFKMFRYFSELKGKRLEIEPRPEHDLRNLDARRKLRASKFCFIKPEVTEYSLDGAGAEFSIRLL